jgi:hypothetical protein
VGVATKFRRQSSRIMYYVFAKFSRLIQAPRNQSSDNCLRVNITDFVGFLSFEREKNGKKPKAIEFGNFSFTIKWKKAKSNRMSLVI